MLKADMPPTNEPTWQSQSADEYAALETATGAKLVSTGNVWWRKVRPFFYRPLLPYSELNPDKQQCPLLSVVGGVQYIVPNGVRANSCMNLIFFEDPHTYSFDSLKPGIRNQIRRAMRAFSVKPIMNLDEFITKGHPVYTSFYERTRYNYKKERTEQRHFATWARTLFSFPKVRIFGAFREQELTSVSVSYLVEDVLFNATLFSRSDSLAEYVSDLMLHAIRERAAASENLKLIFASFAGRERGLDEFYLRRGARSVSRPALLRINPLVLFLLKNFKKDFYIKLCTLT